MGLSLKEGGTSRSQTIPQHLWRCLAEPWVSEQGSSGELWEEWENPGVSPQILGSLKHPQGQPSDLEPILHLSAELWLSFPSPTVSPHFLSGSLGALSAI